MSWEEDFDRMLWTSYSDEHPPCEEEQEDENRKDEAYRKAWEKVKQIINKKGKAVSEHKGEK